MCGAVSLRARNSIISSVHHGMTHIDGEGRNLVPPATVRMPMVFWGGNLVWRSPTGKSSSSCSKARGGRFSPLFSQRVLCSSNPVRNSFQNPHAQSEGRASQSEKNCEKRAGRRVSLTLLATFAGFCVRLLCRANGYGGISSADQGRQVAKTGSRNGTGVF